MNIVNNHVEIVLNLLSFKTFIIKMSSANLPREDLTSYKVFSDEYKLHLVKDKVNLFCHLEGTICFNLNLLNDFSSIIYSSVFF